MKHFTLLLALASITFTTLQSQVLQFEDFNSGIQPPDWTVTNTGIGGLDIGFCEDMMTVFMYDCDGYPSGEGAPTPPGFSGTVATIDYANHPDPVTPNTVGCHVSPVLNTTSSNNLILSFDYEHEDFSGDGLFTVEVFDGAMWQLVFSQDEDASGSQVIDVTAHSNENFQVRYCFDTQTEDGTLIFGCAIDNHQLENVLCNQAGDLEATNIKSTGATISWTDPNMPMGQSYDIEILVSGNPPTGIPTETDVPNPYNWTGATSGTVYDVYIRINCSEGPSSWAGPLTFLAQDPPENDVCADAIPVAVGEEICGPTANGDNTYGEDSGEENPSCGNYQGGDLWYSFVAPASGAVRLSLLSETWSNPYLAVYGGSCGNLDEVYCEIALVGFDEIIIGLTPGATYYLRWWDSGNDQFGPIAFCLEAGVVPSNDSCAGAIEVPVSPVDTCSSSETGNNTFASDSGESTPTCGNYAGGDLWYSFVVPPSGSVLLDVLLEEWSPPYATLYNGSCGDLTEIACELLVSPFDEVFDGLVAGDTLLLRFWDSNNNNFGDIEFCLKSAPLPPANDSCQNAMELVVNVNGSCPAAAVNGTTEGATDDGFTSCDGFGSNNGVWYFFEAPADGALQIIIEEVSGNHEAAVYDTCGGVEIICNSSPGSLYLSSLDPGETYYLLIWSDAGNEGEHNVCLQELPEPPANDSCANAMVVEVGEGGCGALVSGYNTNASDSGEGIPSCNSYDGGDIWYAFTAPATEGVLVQLLNTDWSTPYLAVYSGDCGSLAEIYCDELSISTVEELTGLTAGTDYYLRLWDDNNNDFGDIEFCLRAIPPPITNDSCTNATVINVEAYGDCPANAVFGMTITATDDGDISCDSMGMNNGVWYAFVATDTLAYLQLIELSGNMHVAVFDACGGNEQYCNTSPGEDIISGLVPDSTYYVLVWSGQGSEGYFDLCIQGPPPVPANDSCLNASVLDATTPGVYSIAGTTLGATTGDAPTACNASVDHTTTGGVWYIVNTDNDYDVTIKTCESDYDTELSVYSGDCGELMCIASDDDGCTGPNAFGSLVHLPQGTFLQENNGGIETRSAPVSLYVYVSGHANNNGDFLLEVEVSEPLPLTLISFNGIAKPYGNELFWVTAQESNTDVHRIQRLTSSQKQWETIGTVQAAGFSTSAREYEWVDKDPLTRSSYRIVTVDTDGSEHYSPIVTVYRTGRDEQFGLLSLYPQPSGNRDVFAEVFSPDNAVVELAVFDLHGRLFIVEKLEVNEGINTLQIRAGDLSRGMYVLEIRKGASRIVRKLVVQ